MTLLDRKVPLWKRILFAKINAITYTIYIYIYSIWHPGHRNDFWKKKKTKKKASPWKCRFIWKFWTLIECDQPFHSSNFQWRNEQSIVVGLLQIKFDSIFRVFRHNSCSKSFVHFQFDSQNYWCIGRLEIWKRNEKAMWTD